MQHRTELGRANALDREIVSTPTTTSTAAPERVYDLLADLQSHLIWGGERLRGPRLVSMAAPPGPAVVGTEFTSEGADRAGGFRDASVVTDAQRPGVFGFVTEALLTTKRGIAEWTVVHRYEVEARVGGCAIRYTVRVVRISALPGPLKVFNVPGLRAVALRFAEQGPKRGLRNLARLAEEDPATS